MKNKTMKIELWWSAVNHYNTLALFAMEKIYMYESM